MANKKIFNKIKKTLCLFLCAIITCALSSCQSLKMYFAGEMTDQGMSMESIAQGVVYLPKSVNSDTSYSAYDTIYDNCLFVGNGIMCDFQSAASQWKIDNPKLFNNSFFFCGENFSAYENNYSDPEKSTSPFPTVTVMKVDEDDPSGGEKEVTYKCTVEDAIDAYCVDRVVFCLAGINDLPVYGDEANCHTKTASEMGRLIKKLKDRFNGLSIIVLSTPPISADTVSMKSINNEKIDALNSALEWECTKNGADFINASKLFKDSNGALKKEYCSDGYYRLNEEGGKVILSSLRYYAKARKGEI